MQRVKAILCLFKGHVRSRRHVVDRGELRYSRCKRCGTSLVQNRDRKWLTVWAYEKGRCAR